MKAIRDSLAVCGDCKNCKLLAWKDAQEIVKKDNISKIKINDDVYQYMVRCNWLKSAIYEPDKLEHCEGKQAHSES